MAGGHKSRDGSLQYWPRKRAERLLPSVNWQAINSKEPGFLGFIAYKAGMKSALAKDLTPNSLTKDKKIIFPVSVLECPSMKIFSVRGYKNNKVVSEINLESDKELKRVVKTGKAGKIEDIEKRINEFDDLKVIVYSVAKKTGIKKTPDITEIGLSGNLQQKLELIKKFAGKEMRISDVFKKLSLVDIRGNTKAKGLSGPVKRFGISLKAHKSEKGVRRPGSLGPWHPAHVIFRVPMAGQLGMFSRIAYNIKIIDIKNAEKDALEFPHYGKIRGDYAIIRGSVQGPAKRQLIIASALRATKKQSKKNFELIKLV